MAKVNIAYDIYFKGVDEIGSPNDDPEKLATASIVIELPFPPYPGLDIYDQERNIVTGPLTSVCWFTDKKYFVCRVKNQSAYSDEYSNFSFEELVQDAFDDGWEVQVSVPGDG